jgi:acyl-CoA-binding protein
MAAINAINDCNHIVVRNKSLINGNNTHSNQFKQMMSTEEQFKAAVNVIRSLPKSGPFQPSDELKLKFYAYFKQATEGPNETKKPAFYDIVNKYKWEAWKKLANMSKEKAMESYVEQLKKVVETMSFTEAVTDFYQVLGPFYEFLPPESIASIESSNHKLNGDNEDIEKEITCSEEINIPRINGEDYGVDSEGEEFSDTYDHIGEDGQIPIAARNGTDYSIDEILEARGGADSNPSATISPSNSSINREVSSVRSRNARQSDSRMPVSQPIGSSSIRGTGGTGGGSGSNPQDYSIGINEQLALAVIRLQQSMDQVVNRLDTLESMLTRDSRTRSSPQKKSNLWPFEDIRPHTIFVLLVWPFVAQWIVHYIRQKRRKLN